MEEPTVTRLRAPAAPNEVTLTPQDRNVRFTPRELEAIKGQYGKSLSTLIGDDDSDDKLVVLGWLKLRRAGYQIDLDDMLDVVVSLEGDSTPDPSNGEPSTTSPPSADSGG